MKQVRVLIFWKDPLPSLTEVYAFVHKEELRTGIMNISSTFEKLALVSSSTKGGCGVHGGHGLGRRYNLASNDRDRLKCGHCDRSRHTKE